MAQSLCSSLFLVIFLGLQLFCQANDPIKLHIIVHSHLDEGWIYTFNEYYRGTDRDENGGCVKCILDNVYQSLLKSPERKYQLAETAFFQRWWSEQTTDVKTNVRKLIKQKQLQFVNGGWSANDEACTYYEDIVDNFITGHRWIYNEFELDPNVGWQIDSFGHSATHAALMAQAGYEGIFFGRIDYRDWEQRRSNQALEINWKPQSPHNESLLGHVLFVHYSNSNFLVEDNRYCKSIFCNGRLETWQYDKVREYATLQSKSYKTKNVIMLVGDDFHLWKESEKDYTGIEALIDHFKSDETQAIQAKFSTLSEYLQETSQELIEDELPVKNGDFFPYIENEYTSWVGYYTSKSMFKLKVREASQYYNAAKLLLSKFLLSDNQYHSKIDTALLTMEEALGIVQHHDAITGTMRERVKSDYERMLDGAKNNVEQEIFARLKDYSFQQLQETPKWIDKLNINTNNKSPFIKRVFTSQGNILMTVFNPGETDSFLIKVPVPHTNFKVLDDSNISLVTDIICNNQHSQGDSSEDCVLYFVDKIPAYSIRNYILSHSTLSKKVPAIELPIEREIKIGDQMTIKVKSNKQDFSLRICPSRDSHLYEEKFKDIYCIEDTLSLNYEYYESYPGGGYPVSSGAYVFMPKGNKRFDLSAIVSGTIYQGKHLTLIQIRRKDVRTDIKLIHHELDKGIEIESHLEPAEWSTKGKEIVLMLKSKNALNHNKVFYTDQNGYYMQKRKVNFREDIERREINIPIPSNYYPITSAVYIENPNTELRMTVVTDRAQGATSMKPGEIEIMIHRQTVQDDEKGLAEVLQEEDPDGGPLRVSTRHFLIYSSPQFGVKEKQRERQYKLDRPLQYYLANIESNSFVNSRSEAERKVLNLESNIKFTIRSYEIDEYIIRLHNLDEKNSKFVKIYDLQTKSLSLLNKFAGRNDLKLSSISELSLFTHKKKDQIQKNKLNSSQPDWKNSNDGTDLSRIELLPMEIRTFKIILHD